MHKSVAVGFAVVAGILVCSAPLHARITKIIVDENTSKSLGLKTLKDKKSGASYISNETWKEFLGAQFFGLPSVVKGSVYEESFTPTFRLLCSLARRLYESREVC